MLDILRAAILGVIQAVTEFLPISSSAHLILFRDWLGLQVVDGLAFDVALVVYFRRDLWHVVKGGLSIFRGFDRDNGDQRLALLIVIGSIPAAVIGGVFSEWIDHWLRSPGVIVVTLLAGGALFIVVERRCRPTGGVREVSVGTAVAVGVAQALALVPGVSRAGITIAIGMTRNLRREEAARFSFLLAVPIMVGAGAKSALEAWGAGPGPSEIAVLATGTIVSALSALAVLRYLLRFLQHHSLNGFAYYRFALAGVVVVWLVLR